MKKVVKKVVNTKIPLIYPNSQAIYLIKEIESINSVEIVRILSNFVLK